jgi:hypothetical protein
VIFSTPRTHKIVAKPIATTMALVDANAGNAGSSGNYHNVQVDFYASGQIHSSSTAGGAGGSTSLAVYAAYTGSGTNTNGSGPAQPLQWLNVVGPTSDGTEWWLRWSMLNGNQASSDMVENVWTRMRTPNNYAIWLGSSVAFACLIRLEFSYDGGLSVARDVRLRYYTTQGF